MTTSPTVAADDAARFVAARWPDLEAVALVSLLDPGAAREVTLSTLVALRRRWSEVVEDGAPTATARRDLIDRLAAHPPTARPPDHTHRTGRPTATGPDDLARPAPPADPVHPSLRTAATDPDDPVPAALLDALAASTRAERTALAADVLWDGDLAPGTAPVLAATHDRMLAAHRAARAAAGRAPDDARLDADLDDLLLRLARAQPEPPDPAALVDDRTRRGARRTLLLAGAATVAAGAAGWALLRRNGAATPTTASPRPSTAPTTAGPDDPAWADSSRWPARGPLRADLGIQALVARAGAGTRLLWAGDLDDTRVVIASSLLGERADSTSVRVWTGRSGAAAEDLDETPLGFDAVLGVTDVVAVGVERADDAALVVLTRPTVESARFSPFVRPTSSGAVQRDSRPIRLRNGVGALTLRPWGVAGRLACGAYDGPPVAPRAWGDGTLTSLTASPLDGLLDQVASATGLAREDLRGEVLCDSPVVGSVLDTAADSPTGGDGRVVLSSVRLPGGGVVRRLDVRDDGRSGRSGFLVVPAVAVPAELADAPAVYRLDDDPPGTGRYLVVVPGGGSTCQLLATSPNAYPVSKVTPMKRRTAVVSVVNADDAAAFRLVVRDAGGRLTYRGVPPVGRDLLGDEDTGWLGLPARGSRDTVPVLPNPA
ncbi:hypothetical protein [Arthrobacter sp. NEB 688]|uniref:hypothetical protein n=1 Tax=Arthrobacter sp. NEB 688 TaxID=904039 RepID=UPI0015667123|nr:hypothetical protein [Arthrobacter sp. NEB 688]QKE82708.1 hypothetical protein HL663_01220 [Arthrobacter sp. NEB 688]